MQSTSSKEIQYTCAMQKSIKKRRSCWDAHPDMAYCYALYGSTGCGVYNLRVSSYFYVTLNFFYVNISSFYVICMCSIKLHINRFSSTYVWLDSLFILCILSEIAWMKWKFQLCVLLKTVQISKHTFDSFDFLTANRFCIWVCTMNDNLHPSL